MSEAKIKWREVLSRWQAEQYVDATDSRSIESYLEAAQAASRNRSNSPWYIRVLIGVGAWIAAACILLFFGLAGLLTHDASQIVCGVLLIGGALILRAIAEHDFTTQLALALSVAGHAIILFWASSELTIFLAATLLCGLLYFTYRDWLHRFLSSLLVTITCAVWLADSNYPNSFHFLMLIEVLGIGLFFTGRHGRLPAQVSSALRPLAFALAVSMLGLLLLLGMERDGTPIPLYPSKIILGLSLLYLYRWVSAEEHGLTAEKFILLVIPTLILSAVTTPGILAALALLVIGYARDERLLLALGCLFFPVFLIIFYYNLEVDLLTKSLTLMGSGVVLLAARVFLGRSAWAREKVE
ncbi:MAG: DUF4401 domain-containing protein [Acidobacteriota bacterium]|nr:DUF4401 domain-containing protein [Acidobacteriota bacterium]